jgi:rRNA small subunit pseudouridine methyltransferase Nep1
MHIILADSELELIPDALKADNEIRDMQKRRGKEDILLDNYLMRTSIRRHLPGRVDRVGFPSIAYAFFRMNEESVLKDTLKLEYAIHTKQGIILERRDLEGIGASYSEFVERVEDILTGSHRTMKLVDYLENLDIAGNTVVLHPKGRKDLVMNDQLSYVIGGFPEGDFISDLSGLRKFSIYEKEITVPAVLELLHFRLFQS